MEKLFSLSYLFIDANWLADYRQIPRPRIRPVLQPQRRKFSSAFRRQIEALAPSPRRGRKRKPHNVGRDEVVKLILTKIWCRLVVKIMKISIVSSFLLSFSLSIPFRSNMFIRMYTLSSFRHRSPPPPTPDSCSLALIACKQYNFRYFRSMTLSILLVCNKPFGKGKQRVSNG
jgi:hypothetical protein